MNFTAFFFINILIRSLTCSKYSPSWWRKKELSVLSVFDSPFYPKHHFRSSTAGRFFRSTATGGNLSSFSLISPPWTHTFIVFGKSFPSSQRLSVYLWCQHWSHHSFWISLCFGLRFCCRGFLSYYSHIDNSTTFEAQLEQWLRCQSRFTSKLLQSNENMVEEASLPLWQRTTKKCGSLAKGNMEVCLATPCCRCRPLRPRATVRARRSLWYWLSS